MVYKLTYNQGEIKKKERFAYILKRCRIGNIDFIKLIAESALHIEFVFVLGDITFKSAILFSKLVDLRLHRLFVVL